jgi:hypothetical protein
LNAHVRFVKKARNVTGWRLADWFTDCFLRAEVQVLGDGIGAVLASCAKEFFTIGAVFFWFSQPRWVPLLLFPDKNGISLSKCSSVPI